MAASTPCFDLLIILKTSPVAVGFAVFFFTVDFLGATLLRVFALTGFGLAFLATLASSILTTSSRIFSIFLIRALMSLKFYDFLDLFFRMTVVVTASAIPMIPPAALRTWLLFFLPVAQ